MRDGQQQTRKTVFVAARMAKALAVSRPGPEMQSVSGAADRRGEWVREVGEVGKWGKSGSREVGEVGEPRSQAGSAVACGDTFSGISRVPTRDAG